MTNLEKMKKSICEQIMQMNAEELYDFVKETELEEYDFNFLNMDDVFNCLKCGELYGKPCNSTDEIPPCKERFIKYCLSEVVK